MLEVLDTFVCRWAFGFALALGALALASLAAFGGPDWVLPALAQGESNQLLRFIPQADLLPIEEDRYARQAEEQSRIELAALGRAGVFDSDHPRVGIAVLGGIGVPSIPQRPLDDSGPPHPPW